MCGAELALDDPYSEPRPQAEFSSAFLLACAGVAVISANMIFEFGNLTTGNTMLEPALVMVFAALALSIRAIFRSAKDARSLRLEQASGPNRSGTRQLWLLFAALVLFHRSEEHT